MILFKLLHPRMTQAHLGYIPQFLDERDKRPAREQFDANYRSGWHPVRGMKWLDRPGYVLSFPGDPPFEPLAFCRLRDEVICFYISDFVGIFQPDGSFEVSRMD